MKKTVAVFCLVVLLGLVGNSLMGQCLSFAECAYSEGVYAGQALSASADRYGYAFKRFSYTGTVANLFSRRLGMPVLDAEYEAWFVAEFPYVTQLWWWPYRYAKVSMQWSPSFLANQSCDGDNRLDRPQVFKDTGSYRGVPDCWVTYKVTDGHNVDIMTVQAVPLDAALLDGVWYTADGQVIGQSAFAAGFSDDILRDFAIVKRQWRKNPVGIGLAPQY
jgi:hypothetical protein